MSGMWGRLVYKYGSATSEYRYRDGFWRCHSSQLTLHLPPPFHPPLSPSPSFLLQDNTNGNAFSLSYSCNDTQHYLCSQAPLVQFLEFLFLSVVSNTCWFHVSLSSWRPTVFVKSKTFPNTWLRRKPVLRLFPLPFVCFWAMNT